MTLAPAQQQLLLLREQTRRMGVLHDAQVLQLKMWPRAYFVKSTSATQVSVDIEKKRLVFQVVVAKGKTPEGAMGPSAAASRLAESAHWLLGPSWDVEIRVGSGQRFKTYEFAGKPDEPATKKPHEGRRKPSFAS